MKLILVGFMGVGKTTIGKILAKKLNMEFIDLDEELEKIESKSIEDIFEFHGEKYFRNLENKILKKVISKDNIIISTGGGVLKTNENYNILKNEKNIIFLDANVDTIIKNLSSNQNEINKRPILRNSKDIYITINNLLNERYKKYVDVSSIHIDTNGKNVDEVVSQILVYNR